MPGCPRPSPGPAASIGLSFHSLTLEVDTRKLKDFTDLRLTITAASHVRMMCCDSGSMACDCCSGTFCSCLCTIHPAFLAVMTAARQWAQSEGLLHLYALRQRREAFQLSLQEMATFDDEFLQGFAGCRREGLSFLQWLQQCHDNLHSPSQDTNSRPVSIVQLHGTNLRYLHYNVLAVMHSAIPIHRLHC